MRTFFTLFSRNTLKLILLVILMMPWAQLSAQTSDAIAVKPDSNTSISQWNINVTLFGSSTETCTHSKTGGSSPVFEYECDNGQGTKINNTVTFLAYSYKVLVNGQYHSCKIRQTPPHHTSKIWEKTNWFYSNNNSGTLDSISCNIGDIPYAVGLYPEGTLITTTSSDSVNYYIIEAGKRRSVPPSLATSCSDITSLNTIHLTQEKANRIPTGQIVNGCEWKGQYYPSDNYRLANDQLVSLDSSPHVYLIERNSKRWITNLNTLKSCFSTPLTIKKVASDVLNEIVPGNDISSCNFYSDGTVLTEASSTTQWIIFDGLRMKVNLPQGTTCSFSHGNPTYTVTAQQLNKIPRRYKNITSCDWFPTGAVINEESSPNTDLVQSGDIRYIQSAKVFNDCGYYWNNVIQVPSSVYSTMPVDTPVSGCPPTAALRDKTRGLWAYFPFDVNGNDETRYLDKLVHHDQHATVSQLASYGPGVYGNALYFGYKFAYAKIPSVSEFLTEQSIALWVKVPATPAPTTKVSPIALILGNQEKDTTLGLGYFTHEQKRYLWSAFLCADGATAPQVAPTEIKSNRWIHISVTFDPKNSGTLKLYVNGVLKQKYESIGCTALKPMWGERIGGPSNDDYPKRVFFSGAVDEVYLYKKALTAGEVVALATRPSASGIQISEDRNEGGFLQSTSACGRYNRISCEADTCDSARSSETCREKNHIRKCKLNEEWNGKDCTISPTPVVTVLPIDGEDESNGVIVSITNPSYAGFYVTGEDNLLDEEILRNYVNTRCVAGSPNVAAICTEYDLQQGCIDYGCICRELKLIASNEKPVNTPYHDHRTWNNILGFDVPGLFNNNNRHILINANFFQKDLQQTNHPCTKPMGPVVNNSVSLNTLAPDNTHFELASIIISKSSNTINIAPLTDSELSDASYAATGLRLVRDSKGLIGINPSACDYNYGHLCKKRGRTAVGLTSEGTLLIVVLPDPPKDDKELGKTGKEMAKYMIKNGAVDAVLLDGGGSSKYFDWRLRNGVPEVVETLGPDEDRPVPVIFGVVVPND